jgi:pimeloyl-ACP methyl ester carboxylesterase
MTYTVRRPARCEDIHLRGLRHRLTRWGNAEREPIVLLHGFMDTALTYQFLVDCLPDDWSFAALDWRGFGASTWPQNGYWFPDYLADLEALLDRLYGTQPGRIIGHSMGGNAASLYAGVRPQRLRWLVNLEGFGLPRREVDEAPLQYARWLDELRQPLRVSRYPAAGHLATILRQRNPRLGAAAAEFIAAAWTRPTGDADGSVELVFDPRHRHVNPVLYRRDEAEACWRRIEAPMLLVLGEHSEYRQGLGADGTEAAFAARMRGLTLRVLPGVGHMMHHENPQALASVIEEFVSRQSLRAA